MTSHSSIKVSSDLTLFSRETSILEQFCSLSQKKRRNTGKGAGNVKQNKAKQKCVLPLLVIAFLVVDASHCSSCFLLAALSLLQMEHTRRSVLSSRIFCSVKVLWKGIKLLPKCELNRKSERNFFGS